MQRPTAWLHPAGATGRHHRAARPGCMAPSGSLCIRGLVRPTSRGFAGRRMVRHRGSRSVVAAPEAIRADMVPTPALRVRARISGREVATVVLHGRGRVASIRASSAGWRPQHHTHDEQDEEESHDERERPHVPWMCRLHDAPPPSLSNRIPGRFATSIDARDGPRVALPRVAPRWRVALRVAPRASERGQPAGMFPRTRMATSPARMAVRRPVPMRSRGRGSIESSGLPCGQGSHAVRGVDHGFGQSAPYSTVIVVSPPVGVAVTWTRQPASRWASTT